MIGIELFLVVLLKVVSIRSQLILKWSPLESTIFVSEDPSSKEDSKQDKNHITTLACKLVL